MCHRAVVLAGVPDFIEGFGQLDHVGNFIAGVSLIDIGQGLIVYVLIHSCGIDHVIVHDIVAPVRPVVGLKTDLNVLSVKGDGLGYVTCPCCAVAYFGTSQRVEIVERSVAVLSQPECLVLRQPGVHFRRSFRAGSELEL